MNVFEFVGEALQQRKKVLNEGTGEASSLVQPTAVEKALGSLRERDFFLSALLTHIHTHRPGGNDRSFVLEYDRG